MAVWQRRLAADALAEAFEVCGGGFAGRRRLARRLGLSDRACCAWAQAGYVPASRVLSVEAATRVPRHHLRPDIYPKP